MTNPFPYQDECHRAIDSFGGRILIAMDPGLGKSFVALRWAVCNKAWPMIIVCPASVKWTWEIEAQKHFNLRACVLEGIRPKQAPYSKLYIVNFDILDRRTKNGESSGWLGFLQGLNPSLVAIDECQAVKSQRARRTKAVRTLCRGVPHVLALSGTPLVNRPAELWPTLNVLQPRDYKSFWAFARMHCGLHMGAYGWEANGAERLPLLHATLKREVMFRRRKWQVLADLPRKTRQILPVDPDNLDDYRKAQDDFILWLQKKSPVKAKRARKAQQLVKLGYLLRLAAAGKLRQAVDWIADFLEGGEEKLFVVGVHRDFLGKLRERWPDAARVDGSVVGRERQRQVERFARDPKCRLLIGNIQAAGTGIDGLQKACSTGLCVELPWTPGAVTQVEDRLSRIGQDKPVRWVFMISKNTIEEKLCSILEAKQKILTQTLDGAAPDGMDLNVHALLLKEMANGQIRNGKA